MTKTGWPPGLLQDDSRQLSEWFASRIDARRVVRDANTEDEMTKEKQAISPADDTASDDLGWHALNYRAAHTVHAELMWVHLAACVDRRVAAAVAAERERCAKLCDEASLVSCYGDGLDGAHEAGASVIAKHLANMIRRSGP